MSSFKVALVLALVAMALTTRVAKAGEVYSSRCDRNGCVFLSGEVSAAPHIIKVPKSVDAEREARIAQWEAYCQPRVVVGDFGVERYVYARKDCEYGRRSD